MSKVWNEEHEIFSKIFHGAEEGILVFNQEGEVEKSNPRAWQMFGYPSDEVAGLKVEQLIPTNLRSKHVKHRERYVKNPSPRPMGVGLDLEGLRKDGTTFPLEISLNNISHEGETKIIAFITDISVRKEHEKTVENQRILLEKHASQLKGKVKERTEELEHMNLGLQSQIQERRLAQEALQASLEDLRKAEKEILKSLEKEKELNEMKSRFVSMASHEFRTPLTTILSSANLIAKYDEPDQQTSREKHINRIKQSVQNLTSILNDFLSLEKLESGALHVNISDVELSALLDEVVEEITPTLKQGQQIKLRKVKVNMNTDPHLLKNMLFNLLSNASKYSNQGETIRLSASEKKGEVEIQVEDNGIGIPASEQRNLFERFYRAANATNIQGTGLGLNIVKKYIDLLGGSISFESQEAKGSKFSLRIPHS